MKNFCMNVFYSCIRNLCLPQGRDYVLLCFILKTIFYHSHLCQQSICEAVLRIMWNRGFILLFLCTQVILYWLQVYYSAMTHVLCETFPDGPVWNLKLWESFSQQLLLEGLLCTMLGIKGWLISEDYSLWRKQWSLYSKLW